MEYTIYALSGPDPYSRTALIQRLADNYPSLFSFPAVTTTKDKEDDEQSTQVVYVTHEQMEEMIKRKEMYEYRQVDGHYVGTHRDAVYTLETQNKVCLMDVDRMSIEALCESLPSVKFISIIPSSIELLQRRLIEDEPEKEKQIIRQMEIASADMPFFQDTTIFDKVIVCDDPETVYAEFEDTLAEAFNWGLLHRPEIAMNIVNRLYFRRLNRKNEKKSGVEEKVKTVA